MGAFKLWFWRFLRVPWTARASNQSILKEINSEYSLPGLMLKLKLQYFGRVMWRADSLETTLVLGKIDGKRKKETTEDETVGWHHWLNGRESEQTPGDSEGRGSLACCSPWGHRVRHDLATEHQLGLLMKLKITLDEENNCILRWDEQSVLIDALPIFAWLCWD